jgi:hypothetical protein
MKMTENLEREFFGEVQERILLNNKYYCLEMRRALEERGYGGELYDCSKDNEMISSLYPYLSNIVINVYIDYIKTSKLYSIDIPSESDMCEIHSHIKGTLEKETGVKYCHEMRTICNSLFMEFIRVIRNRDFDYSQQMFGHSPVNFACLEVLM